MGDAAEAVVEQLKRLGVSGYEAKAYAALVAGGQPLSGYEVAKQSGVPRSTVYETLSKLIARGAAFEVRAGDGSTNYLALPGEALLARLRRDFTEAAEGLAAALPDLSTPVRASLVHHLQGQKAVLERARDVIDGAVVDLHLSMWAEEATVLAPLARSAEGRGVDVSIVAFGEFEPVGMTVPHRFSSPEVVLERVGCRLLVVAADRRSVLIGGAAGGEMWGLYADDPAVVLVAVEFVRHDIAMQVLVERWGGEEAAERLNEDPVLAHLATGRGAPALDLRRPANLV
jgi:HTH-type transcriptional regulator, sugar sensing transcriptional regulator